MSAVPPIHREILVNTDPASAFRIFTEHIGDWWPLAELSVLGAGATVGFADGEIIERSADGRTAVWGTVTRWEPPAALAFTWHPGKPAERASRVEVTFAAASPAGLSAGAPSRTPAGTPTGTPTGEDGKTLVTLEHTGWEVFDDPASARDEYDHGWPRVLDLYRDHAGGADGSGPQAGETWVALLHRPGPAAPRTGSLFEDPRFGEHVAFLNRMREAGYLVAAGPLEDAAGEGMTILRLPGAEQLGLAERLATEDDTSVAGGFFSVTVRPWRVVMHTALASP